LRRQWKRLPNIKYDILTFFHHGKTFAKQLLKTHLK